MVTREWRDGGCRVEWRDTSQKNIVYIIIAFVFVEETHWRHCSLLFSDTFVESDLIIHCAFCYFEKETIVIKCKVSVKQEE